VRFVKKGGGCGPYLKDVDGGLVDGAHDRPACKSVRTSVHKSDKHGVTSFFDSSPCMSIVLTAGVP